VQSPCHLTPRPYATSSLGTLVPSQSCGCTSCQVSAVCGAAGMVLPCTYTWCTPGAHWQGCKVGRMPCCFSLAGLGRSSAIKKYRCKLILTWLVGLPPISRATHQAVAQSQLACRPARCL